MQAAQTSSLHCLEPDTVIIALRLYYPCVGKVHGYSTWGSCIEILVKSDRIFEFLQQQDVRHGVT